MEESIFKFVRDYYCLKGDEWFIERFVDYDEEFPKSKIKSILDAKNPREEMDCVEGEWTSSADWDYQDDFWKKFRTFCSERFFNLDEAKDIVYENFEFYYPKSFMNPQFDAVIRINAGDMNFDYTCHNVLNYARREGYSTNEDGGLVEEAGLYWLAKQQGRLELLQRAIMESDGYSDGQCEESKFVASAITSLVNLPTYMSALTFLVKMNLKDAINILQVQKDRKEFDQYHPQKTDGMPFGHLTLGKETTCLLFDEWDGSGSLETIELDKDVTIPIHYIQDIDVDDRVQSVYEFVSGVWKDSVKEVDIK